MVMPTVLKRGRISDIAQAIVYGLTLRNTEIVNISLRKRDFNLIEYKHIKRAISDGIRINAAASNEGVSLDAGCIYYPACYGKLISQDLPRKHHRGRFRVIGAQAPWSNYGNVVDIFLDPTPRGIPRMRGTSQATALYTNMLVRKP
jgi:hypothetical protein